MAQYFQLLVTSEDEAKLRPKTSVEVVKLAPICSISLLFPPDIISLFFLLINHLPEIPYLNLSSLKP